MGRLSGMPRPLFWVGNPYNDYGLGFYCTESPELACEWACPKAKDGFANAYDLALSTASTSSTWMPSPTGTIEWLAVLFANRQFDVATNLMEAAKSYVAARYPAELGKADVIIGYRADDSYSSFARAFLENRISLAQQAGYEARRPGPPGGRGERGRFRSPHVRGCRNGPGIPVAREAHAAGREGPARFLIAFCTKSPLIPPACTCST